jgi:uncharacterized membrane protein YgcG
MKTRATNGSVRVRHVSDGVHASDRPTSAHDHRCIAADARGTRGAIVHVAARGEQGFAIIIVLLVLLALLVMSTPFLLAARNADRSSSELADQASARLALDSAEHRARAGLGATHPAQDTTPYWDSLDEIKVDNRFDPRFLDANDPHGVMWDLDVEDVAGKIDLNSASPHVIANLMGASARFADVIAKDAKKISVSSTSGLLASGFVWSGGELIRYGKLDEGELKDFDRGVLGTQSEKEWRGGPAPPLDHDNGAPVLDQRAFAPALWRIAGGDGDVRRFAAMEELRQAKEFVFAGALAGDVVPSAASLGSSSASLRGSSNAAGKSNAPDAAAKSNDAAKRDTTSGAALIADAWGEDTLRSLFAHGSVFGGVRGGRAWQRAARLVSQVEGHKDGQIKVDNVRWFNPGATLEITDGQSKELALVSLVRKDGTVVLDRILANDYAAFTAEVRVLARRPVNLNTARPDVLKILFTNLQLNGRNSRITKDRAQQLAELVVESRPFTGHEDFLRRVVLPAAGLEKLPSDAEVHPDMLASGSGFIDAYEALALYTNGLNANDSSLVYSTMPYSFTTRDTYALELRASVNAPSGVERFSLVRDEVEMVTPQAELFTLWSRQEDFDEAMRLDGEGPWWMSGPNATSQWDSGTVPPSRLWANMGTYGGKVFLPGVTDTSGMQDKESQPTAEHVFASRDKDGWIQLWPARIDEKGQREGRVLHFDHETRDPEGRYLPDEPVKRSVSDKQVAWSGKNGLMLPLSCSLWVKPRSLTDSTLLDVMSGVDERADRVQLLFEQGDLVLRVIDGVGDHPQTSEKELGEVRYQLAKGSGPGLPADIWSHIAIDVHGNQPHQMSMLVNGLDHGVRKLGLTRLTGQVPLGAASLPVESVEGFPPHCTVRVGNELVEVEVANGQLMATRHDAGELAGFGGRIAREQYRPVGNTTADWIPETLGSITTDHPSGTPVELYGYSLPVWSDVPTGNSQLAAPLGRFRVARLAGVVGGPAEGEPIQSAGAGPLAQPLGVGMKGRGSMVTGLILGNADQPGNQDTPQTWPADMSAFQQSGGYAAIIAILPPFQNDIDKNTPEGDPIGGVEVIRYSGYNGTTLQIAARGDAVTQLPNLAQLTPEQKNLIGGRRALIAKWNPSITIGAQGTLHVKDILNFQTYVVPISLGVPGAGQVNGYLAAKAKDSRFAQLTHVKDAENTEWVRYDWFDSTIGQLVRDDPYALAQTYWTVVYGAPGDGASTPPDIPKLNPPPGNGGGGGGNGGNGGNGGHGGNAGGSGGNVFHMVSSEGGQDDGGSGGSSLTAMMSSPPVSAPIAQQQYAGSSQWDPRLGKNENVNPPTPLSDAIASGLQFRGVFGTYSHPHPAGTPILPVFMTSYVPGEPDEGRPGRLDVAFLVDASPAHLGWPVRVHRSHIPGTRVPRLAWQQDPPAGAQNINPQPVVVQPNPTTITQDQYLLDKLYIYVALQDKSPELMVHGSGTANATTQVIDTRSLTRLVSFPSGERPRLVTNMSIGGSATGGSGVVPTAVVDEIVFGDAKCARGAGTDPDATSGASLILLDELGENASSLRLAAQVVRIPLGRTGSDHKFFDDTTANGGLRKDGGLLRIGDEILAYDSRDASTGVLTLAPSGRGLLGTRPQPHHASEPVMYLEHHTVTSLTGSVGPGDAMLPVGAVDEFPNEGTVLVGAELIHYTRLRDGRLEMPRASSVPGAMDAKGEGLFRGRYGTVPASHSTGEAVILFPIRYWDRWAEHADAPELGYFAFAIDQPAAFWTSFFFDKTDVEGGNVGVLQRTSTDAPWDADPEKDKRVQLYWQGDVQGKPIPIGAQSDRVEWRVFTKFAPNAFDLKTGMPHGWTETPRLRRLGAFYYGPNVVLRSVER